MKSAAAVEGAFSSVGFAASAIVVSVQGVDEERNEERDLWIRSTAAMSRKNSKIQGHVNLYSIDASRRDAEAIYGKWERSTTTIHIAAEW